MNSFDDILLALAMERYSFVGYRKYACSLSTRINVKKTLKLNFEYVEINKFTEAKAYSLAENPKAELSS